MVRFLADHTTVPGSLSSAAAAPELMAVRMQALLSPPSADMNTSFRAEAFISRWTSCKKDMGDLAACYCV